MQKIVIFGTGDFAELAYYYFNNDINYEVVAFTVNKLYISTDKFLGLPLIPFEIVESIYPQDQFHMFVAVGYTQINKVRSNIYMQAKSKGYRFASFISNDAIIAKNVQLGANSFILEGVIVQPFVKVGDAVILWSGCHIGHHSIINNYCFIAPNASLSGNVIINEGCFIGNSAVIRDSVEVGRECVIGAGVAILGNTVEKSVYKSIHSMPMGISSDQLRSI
ncbi:acetyltransferase [Paenibacillus sp. FSL H8-0034]|uniref:acetyltransferase n=1 Tax=Paenibacillus sp. FSL H8-0034 TaxID=2954671 RepID=UPI0030FAA97E